MKKVPAYVFLSLLLLLFVSGSVSAVVSPTPRSAIAQSVASATSSLKAQLQVARADFQTRLAVIKDANKKLIAERIDQNIARINKNRTDHFGSVLARLTTILDRIQTRSDKAKAVGNDVSTVVAAIAEAKVTIATAQAAVTTQAGKDYVLTFTDDSGLKVGASTAKTQLGADLKTVFDKVTLARTSVVTALKDLALIKNVDQDATPSAKEKL